MKSFGFLAIGAAIAAWVIGLRCSRVRKAIQIGIEGILSMSALQVSLPSFRSTLGARQLRVNIRERKTASTDSRTPTLPGSESIVCSPSVGEECALVQQAIGGDSRAKEQIFTSYIAQDTERNPMEHGGMEARIFPEMIPVSRMPCRRRPGLHFRRLLSEIAFFRQSRPYHSPVFGGAKCQ